MSESVGCGVAGEERRSGHDLARLAVAALNDLAVEPGLLDLGAGRRCADCLDRRDLGVADAVDGGDAGTGGDAVDMHGAGAAERHAAAELRAGHAEHVAQHPEKWRVAVDIDALPAAVDFDGGGHGVLSRCINGDQQRYRRAAWSPLYDGVVDTLGLVGAGVPRANAADKQRREQQSLGSLMFPQAAVGRPATDRCGKDREAKLAARSQLRGLTPRG